MAKSSKSANAQPARKGRSNKRNQTQRDTAMAMSTERMGEVRRRKTEKLQAGMDPKTGRPRR